MKLLFNKSNNGSTELKSLLGFIDADLKFDNVKPDVITSTQQLIKLIGKDLYNAIEVIYQKTTPTDDEKDLIYTTRYPIAVMAYQLYAPNNDLAHTNNGRKMISEENEKSAFEWMIERDNKALERRYYRALDDLVLHLDDCPISDIKTAWLASDAYKATHNLFVRTVDEFNEYFPIESRLIYIKLAKGLKDAETLEILPIVGKEKFETLKTALKSNDTISDEDKSLIKLIQNASVMYAMAWAMPRLSVSIFPEGVLQYFSNTTASIISKQPTKKSETEAARQAFMDDFSRALAQIELFLSEPPTPGEFDAPDMTIISGTNYIST